MSPADSPDRSGSGKKQPKSQPRHTEQPEDAGQPGDQQPGDTEQPEPLNRAERRAQRRGKRPVAQGGDGPVQQPRHSVVLPRRASRRGNR
jgi:hypothetical protein